jgi:phosphoadenosine phosphosulfate reductase
MQNSPPYNINEVELNTLFENYSTDEILEYVYKEFGDDVAMSTGFGPSGLVLMHKLSLLKPGASVFYLDTDLLFGETYTLIGQLKKTLNLEFVRVRSHMSLEQQAVSYGKDLWVNNADRCCFIRKVLPLKAFLHDKKAWISGVRRDQSSTRKQADIISWNEQYGAYKVNPLAKWTEDEVWDYIRYHQIPYNELHDKDYPSIGCVPCTKPIESGQNIRSGRWAGTNKTECGIHF